jgi:elongation factor 2
MSAGFCPNSSAALRITDGALLFLSYSEGVPACAETALRQALAERVKPVLVITNIESAFESQGPEVDRESVYRSLQRIIDDVNSIIGLYSDSGLGDVKVSPCDGTVIFASGRQIWAFTLRQFASRYCNKLGINVDMTLRALWGDHYFDSGVGQWSENALSCDGRPLERAFNQFVLDPIIRLSRVASLDREAFFSLIEELHIPLSVVDRSLEPGDSLLKVVMRKFLPFDDALLEAITRHLPSPQTAQRYRVDALYEGSMNDKAASGIRRCDPDGPLVVYVPKILSRVKTRPRQYFVLGRVFSGTVRKGSIVYIQSGQYAPGTKQVGQGTPKAPVERLSLSTGPPGSIVDVDVCTAGNIVVLEGIDHCILKAAMLTSSDTTHNIRPLKLAAPPVVQIEVDAVDPKNWPKLLEVAMNKADLDVDVRIGDTGELVVAGSSWADLDLWCKVTTSNVLVKLSLIL